MNANAYQIASMISEIVLNKGTCFAGFDYNGTRRNVALGVDMSKHSKGVGRVWGVSKANGSLIEYGDNLYIQGLTNNEPDGERKIKCFRLDKVSNLVIG